MNTPAALILGVATGLIVWALRYPLVRRREMRRSRQAARDAAAKIIADGRIEGPKGKYTPRRWASGWIDYLNSLRMPRSGKEMSAPDLPRYPHLKE